MHACLSWVMTGPPVWSSSRRHCLHASTGRVYINITYDNGHGVFWECIAVYLARRCIVRVRNNLLSHSQIVGSDHDFRKVSVPYTELFSTNCPYVCVYQMVACLTNQIHAEAGRDLMSTGRIIGEVHT